MVTRIKAARDRQKRTPPKGERKPVKPPKSKASKEAAAQ